ncbi:hypothetical protein FXO38_00494 [Capsicum annuum]|nr:hypothetical protein FXO38_00494 [Capsicum annuum]
MMTQAYPLSNPNIQDIDSLYHHWQMNGGNRKGGANGLKFRQNFRSLVDCHKPPLVALLETKMQDHLVLLNDFSFNKVIEVPRVGNGEGLVVLSDDSLLEFSDVATTNQEIHAIMKHDPVPVGSSPQRLAPFGAAPSICRLTWPTYKQLFWRTSNPWISSICAPGGGYGHTRPLPWPEHCHRMHSPILKFDIASCMCTWPLLRPSRATLNPWPLSQASFLDMPSHVLWHSQT